MSPTRREFLKRTAAASASIALPMVASRPVLGANDQISVGVVGLGGRGSYAHVPRMETQEGVSVVALAEVDAKRLATRAEQFEDKYGHKPGQYTDMRHLFDRKDIDVVSNATQNYWHGLSTIWACQAGKDVYCEKPLSHYIWEGRQMVEAARKHDRIVQCGTQRRSQKAVIDAVDWIQAGNLGKIRYIVAFANKPRWPIGKLEEPLEIPPSIDYDLWCGPARKVPIYRPRLQYDCSFVWNTGDGESCNQGVHEVDMARWCLGETQLPRRVVSMGGRFAVDDAANVPNTQIIFYDFPTAPILYEVHNLPVSKKYRDDRAEFRSHVPSFRGQRTGICVQCEGGYVNIPAGKAYDADGKQVAAFSGGEDHFQNFIAAVRSRRREDLRADVLVGHVSTAVCHTGNISYRVGRKATEAEMRKTLGDNAAWNAMFDRFIDHLKAHEIDVDAPTVTMGPWLEIDRDAERFKDHAEANELARGYYREPYVVPDVSV
jgi:predicted dehydrogenase